MIQKILLIITTTISIIALQSGQLLTAATVPVELIIPETLLQVVGRASPNALVSIKEAGNVITSTTADSSGNFSAFVGRTAGLHTISTEYVDINGVQSQTNTQTISINSQQTTIQTLFLSPTLSRPSTGSVVSGSIVQFRGYTIPNALVTMRIDYSAFSYETISDANGFYEYLLDSREIGLGNHIATTITSSGASLSDVSLSSSFEIVPITIPSPPDIIVAPSQLPPPTTQSPNDGAVIDGDRVTIYGDSIPGAQINIYENNVLSGSVFADKYGKWSLDYTARFTPVTLSFEACIDGKCSLMSKTLTLEFSTLNESCQIDIRLEDYRFWGIESGSSVALKNTENSPGVVNIDWGNGIAERFDVVESSTQSFEYEYKYAGSYSGKITIQSRGDDKCQKERFFSVQVTDEISNSSLWLLMWVLLFIVSIIGIYSNKNRNKQNTTQKQ